MRAIEITQPGGPEVLVETDLPSPTLSTGQVLVKVEASGVNRPDVFQRQGKYPPPPGASELPGLEVAGHIVEGDFTGDNPFGLKEGDAVCALVSGGGYAEYAAVPLAQCLPIPEGLTSVEAASLPENYFTVWSNVFDRGHLGRWEKSETLLVQGGSSGIGVTAIQFAHLLGHRVFATAGSDEKCRACEAYGAERGINYRTEDFVEIIQTATVGRGADVILDMVAGDYIPREIQALAPEGRLVVIATLGGAKAEIDLATIMHERLTITGSTLRPRPVEFKAAIARRLHETIWPLVEQGAIRPVIHSIFPASQAAQAHELMESSTHIGKIVLSWD